MIAFGTAQMAKGREITKKGHRAVDITVKSGMAIFAPTWDMVMGYKNGSLSAEDYTIEYRRMMWESYYRDPEQWHDFILEGEGRLTFLLCFCRDGEFCHRHLLKPILEEVAEHHVHLEVIQPKDWPRRQDSLPL